jgi:hypothetical protein
VWEASKVFVLAGILRIGPTLFGPITKNELSRGKSKTKPKHSESEVTIPSNRARTDRKPQTLSSERPDSIHQIDYTKANTVSGLKTAEELQTTCRTEETNGSGNLHDSVAKYHPKQSPIRVSQSISSIPLDEI